MFGPLHGLNFTEVSNFSSLQEMCSRSIVLAREYRRNVLAAASSGIIPSVSDENSIACVAQRLELSLSVEDTAVVADAVASSVEDTFSGCSNDCRD